METKYLKFVITGEDNNYIDMSSVCLFFDVVNTSTTAGQYLRPLGESHAFFTRYRCNAAGQQINDIDNYNQVCEEMKSFKSEEVRNLDDIQEGCLTRYDSRTNVFAYTIESHDATATAGSNQRGVVLPKLTRINTTGIEQGKVRKNGSQALFWNLFNLGINHLFVIAHLNLFLKSFQTQVSQLSDLQQQ